MELSLQNWAALSRSWPADYDMAFNLCHMIVSTLSVRKDAGRPFGRTNPIAAWASCIMTVFAGSLVANPLLGKPILAALSDEAQLVMATLVFLVVFYCPGDLGFSLITIPPVYATVCTMKEIQRALKVTKGIKEGLEFNPNSAFAAVLIGTIKGNGSGFCTPFTRAIRGVWSGNELLKPSVTTKLCLLLAIGIYSVSDSATLDIVYLIGIGLFVSVKLSVIFGDPVDPLAPIEKLLCNVLAVISSHGADDKKTN